MKQTKVEEQRNPICSSARALILATLVLNVFDSATAVYLILRYGLFVEANPIAYVVIANAGIVGFLLLKLAGVTLVLLACWFLVEAIQTSGLVLLTFVTILAVFGILAYAVISNFFQLINLI